MIIEGFELDSKEKEKVMRLGDVSAGQVVFVRNIVTMKTGYYIVTQSEMRVPELRPGAFALLVSLTDGTHFPCNDEYPVVPMDATLRLNGAL